MADSSRHPERPIFRPAAVAAAALLLTGCGPTPEQVFWYEVVLVLVGFGLGMAMVGLGRLIGRRWRGGWFACPACGHRQRRGRGADCPACGAPLFVSTPGARSVQPLAEPGGRVTKPRWHTLLWAAGFAAVTYGVLMLPRLVLCCTGLEEGDLNVEYEDLVLFPLAFVFLTAPAGVAIGLLFFSFHMVLWILEIPGVGSFSHPGWWATAYGGTFAMLAAHWYVGLRRLRLGWVLPAGIAAVNLLAAALGYVLK